MAAALLRLARAAYTRRRVFLAIWLAVLILVGVAGAALKSSTDDAFSVPGTESERALNLLDAKFPGTGGATARIVFAAPAGHTLSEKRYQAVVDPTVAQARKVPQTVGGSAAFTGSLQVSKDKTVAFADLHFAVPVAKITPATKAALARVAGPARTAGLTVAYSGGVIATASSGGSSADAIGVLAAFIILSITFWALVPASIPLITALIGVGIGLFGINAATGIVKLNSSAPTLALMLGLAVGIDYALFIISRYRQNHDHGLSPVESVTRAVATAGSAVVFAGVTVVIALVGLTVVGIPFLSAMGLAAAGTVVVAVLIAITLMPAVLGLLGARAAGHRRSLPEVTLGRRWAGIVTRNPVLAVVGVIVLFAVIALPALHLRQGLPGDSTKPKKTTERQAYDLLAKGFGAGFNGPLTVVVDATGRPKTELATIQTQVVAGLGKFPDVAAVSAAIPNSTGEVSIIQVTPASGPTSAATKQLVDSIRTRAGPVAAKAGIAIYVTGTAAVNIDTSDKLASALPIFIALIVGLALILLIIVFRSLFVPLAAVLGFLLTIGASLGAVTFVFQDGHGLSLIGGSQTGPVISFLPVLMVAILFGLSMDYEVFLVSRMREAFTHGDTATDATVNGFAASARVVTTAALIMTSVFIAFIIGGEIVIKSIAFSLAFGVVFDAFLVRMTLIPAIHQLLGDRAWWLPGWLARILPNVDIEGHTLPPPIA
jgi:RND superfamily putative drug exporter